MFAKSLKAPGAMPIVSTESSQSKSEKPRRLRLLFIGPHGLRAGWRVLIFVILVFTLLAAFLLIRNGGVQGFQEARKHANEIVHTPLLIGGSEGMAFVLVCFATLIMGRIEHRKFGEYGLPIKRALGKEFWVGALIGFGMLSGTLLIMFLLHGFRITGLALHGTAILSALVAWGFAFFLVGLCEEFMYRGYLQYTLAAGIGFWPSALVMSGLFAFGHSFNANETRTGVMATGLFALLLCLFLRRTGSLWCAVGFHMGYDWSQTFYGVADSGMLPYHNTFSSVFSGPTWLTGGIVGPEASFLTPIAIVIVAVIFTRLYRENQYPVPA